jgi:hypothetical protein
MAHQGQGIDGDEFPLHAGPIARQRAYEEIIWQVARRA